MIVKMIQNLENKMELQINSLESRIEKMQDMFNKDLEEIKKTQYIMNNAINEIKNTLVGINSRITEAENRISEAEDRMVEINEAERKKEKNNNSKQMYPLHCDPLASIAFLNQNLTGCIPDFRSLLFTLGLELSLTLYLLHSHREVQSKIRTYLSFVYSQDAYLKDARGRGVGDRGPGAYAGKSGHDMWC